MRLRIVGTDLPGCDFHDAGCSERTWTNVHVGIQRRREVVDLVAGDAQRAVFDVDVKLCTGRDGRLEPRGPCVQGRPGERFIYLSWGTVDGAGHFKMFRRLKLWIGRLDEQLLRRADALGRRLELRLALADERGGPVCGSGDPERLDWACRGGLISLRCVGIRSPRTAVA